MKQFGRILSAAVLAATGLFATPATSTAQTYRWKGADVSKLTEGFYLYNVGTGKFVVAGGGWGIQAMLLYQDYGAEMTLTSAGTTDTYRIKSGVENADHADATYLGINYPEWTNAGKWHDNNSYGPILEAQNSGTATKGKYSIKWEFEPVSTDGTHYVYNMKETITDTITSGSTKTTIDTVFYMGAGYGVSPETGIAGGWNVSVEDTATFTCESEFEASFKAGTDKAAYYQWILVPKSEFESSHLSDINAGGGLNANMTYLIKDPFFDRNRNDGFKEWTSTSTATGSDGYRYNWYGNTTTTDRPYSKAVFQKIQINTKANGMYAFGSFDGIGSASQSFKAPAAGTYEIECRGLYQGNEAKLYATVGTGTNAVPVESPFVAATGFTKCTLNSSSDYGGVTKTEAQLAAIGKALYDNESGKYTVKVLVTAKKGDQITIGVKKDEATKSGRAYYSYRSSYYYDTDLVAVDNFAIRYVGKDGTKPYVLDDEAESTDYMKNAEYDDVTVYLKRSFTLNKWNTFVSPLTITAAQAKQAFGDDVQVAKLVGVGGVTGKPGSIDFQTVDLTKEGNAIDSTSMYLIKPTKDGTEMTVETDNGTKKGKMYLLGRRALDGKKLCDEHENFKEPEISAGSDKEGATAQQQVDFKGTYIMLNAGKGPQEGSYVFSGGDMYHLKSAMKIKGFRGWFVNHDGAHSLKFNIDGGSVTSIDEVIANDRGGNSNDAVYTVDGIKVRDNATSLEGLPAGLYIFKGKTHLVK